MSFAKPILLQIATIVVVGSLIGVADAFVLRPVRLGMEVPKKADFDFPSTNGVKPAPHDTSPVPANAHPAATAPASQPKTDFKPTPADQLPAGHITLDDGKKAFDNQSAAFVDARKAELYEAAHIPRAFKIELHDFSAGDPQVLMMIPRDSNVIVYCSGGNCDESVKVAEMLNGSGYKNVYVLHDGLPGWQAMGWPTESGKGMMP